MCMKRSILALLLPLSIWMPSASAQTLDEGKHHLHAMRPASAVAHFEKMLAASPNNPEVIYWLGQAHLEMLS